MTSSGFARFLAIVGIALISAALGYAAKPQTAPGNVATGPMQLTLRQCRGDIEQLTQAVVAMPNVRLALYGIAITEEAWAESLTNQKPFGRRHP